VDAGGRGLHWITWASVAVAAALAIWLSWPRQEGDPTFDARVARPTYPAAHPRVLFDEAHFNVHKSKGRYKPFAELIANDGYRVEPNTHRFTEASVAGHDVLVIANALGFWGVAQAFANRFGLEGKVALNRSAFTPAKRDAVTVWVRRGGSLLLIADHSSCGEAARQLSLRFGVDMTNWYAEDNRPNHDPETDNWGFLLFSRANGLLLDHPITRGRDDQERIDKVLTFTGQSLRPPPGSTTFLKLSPTAREYPKNPSPDWDFRSAANLAQGVALEFGDGRVVVLGEAAVLTSQVARFAGQTFRFGMSREGYDNRQLALNIMHWLSHTLN
jgi:hypothetical protein